MYNCIYPLVGQAVARSRVWNAGYLKFKSMPGENQRPDTVFPVARQRCNIFKATLLFAGAMWRRWALPILFTRFDEIAANIIKD